MARRFFSASPEMGITRYFHYDDMTDTASIETVQDVSQIVDAASKARNGFSRLDRWGEGRTVAFIPMSIYAQWMADGRDKDDAFLRRWLNDPENARLRVFPGQV